MSSVYRMTLIKGDYKEISVTREDASANRVPFSGHIVRFTIRNFEDSAALVTLTSADPSQIRVPELHDAAPAAADIGTALIKISSTQTSAFPLASLLYDVEVEQVATGNKTTILRGTINVLEEITR